MSSLQPIGRFSRARRPLAPHDLGLALIGAVMIVLATVILIGLFAFLTVLSRMV